MIRLLFIPIFCLLGLSGNGQRLVMPGDHPDPSVVKIGDTFWASATTSNWMPAYPLMKSTNLVDWQTVGNVFYRLPSWADYYFWAPEISYDNGKVYIYYSAHKKNGNLCVAVASADRPEGPYRDHGPLMCEVAGSIDAFPIRDETGKLFLVWKEDGNSVGKTTPIWIQEMNEERTALIGQKKEIFRNDVPWEGSLVEGVSMIRQGKYIYAFYAAAACCGSGCNYVTGLARATKLEGPWEKYPGPILQDEGGWKCLGHGTAVQSGGRNFFMYHAYDSSGGLYTGRQALLKEFNFSDDGWIRFIKGKNEPLPAFSVTTDEFDGRSLNVNWQWSVFKKPGARLKKGILRLNGLPDATGAFLGQKTMGLNYETSTTIIRTKTGVEAGIGLVGDDKNMIAAMIKGDSVIIRQVKGGKDSILYISVIKKTYNGTLTMSVRNGMELSFLYGSGHGDRKVLNSKPFNGSFLPPWDSAPRIALIAVGKKNRTAYFERFVVQPLSSY